MSKQLGLRKQYQWIKAKNKWHLHQICYITGHSTATLCTTRSYATKDNYCFIDKASKSKNICPKCMSIYVAKIMIGEIE